MVKNELPNLLASQEMNYPTHFSSVPTRDINSERSLKYHISIKKAQGLKFLFCHTVCEGQTNIGVPICYNGCVFV